MWGRSTRLGIPYVVSTDRSAEPKNTDYPKADNQGYFFEWKKAGWYKSIVEQIWSRNYLLHYKGKPYRASGCTALQTPSSQEESGLTSGLDYITDQ